MFSKLESYLPLKGKKFRKNALFFQMENSGEEILRRKNFFDFVKEFLFSEEDISLLDDLDEEKREEHSFEINYLEEKLLSFSCTINDLDTIEYLLEERSIFLNKRYLKKIFNLGHLDLIIYLTRQEKDIEYYTCLAIKEGYFFIVKYIFEEFNIKPCKEYLILAELSGNTEIVKYLSKRKKLKYNNFNYKLDKREKK